MDNRKIVQRYSVTINIPVRSGCCFRLCEIFVSIDCWCLTTMAKCTMSIYEIEKFTTPKHINSIAPLPFPTLITVIPHSKGMKMKEVEQIHNKPLSRLNKCWFQRKRSKRKNTMNSRVDCMEYGIYLNKQWNHSKKPNTDNGMIEWRDEVVADIHLFSNKKFRLVKFTLLHNLIGHPLMLLNIHLFNSHSHIRPFNQNHSLLYKMAKWEEKKLFFVYSCIVSCLFWWQKNKEDISD